MAREIVRRGERLGERQEIIAELVEAIAHDVRTPLEALSLTLNQASRGQYGDLPEAYSDVVRESRISIASITRIADTLLAFARFESQSATPECGAVDAAALVRDMVSEFTPLAEAREVALTHDIPETACVWANLDDLRRAIANLLANAIRHTSPGGRISLDVRACALGWTVDVVDDGVGISPAQAATLFSRYKRDATGTGLGLHIVRRIVESFGGSVSYVPVSPHGSRFSMTLLPPRTAV
jgi:signal transduction histidine kinase